MEDVNLVNLSSLLYVGGGGVSIYFKMPFNEEHRHGLASVRTMPFSRFKKYDHVYIEQQSVAFMKTKHTR